MDNSNAFSNVEKTTNIIKRYFYKFIDLPDQSFSEKVSTALALLKYMRRKNMCDESIVNKAIHLRDFTIRDLNISVYKLDRRVNSNDATDYTKDKNTTIQITDLSGVQKKLTLMSIQEVLFKTIDELTDIVQEQIHLNKLDDYWS